MAKKVLTLEEATKRLEWLGVDGETDEDFQKGVNEKYIPAETLHESPQFKTALGKTFGSATSGIHKQLKTFGVELSNEDIKDKKFEDIIDIGLKKMVEQHTSVLEEVKKQSSTKPSEREKELEEKLKKRDSDYSVIELANKTQKEQFETERSNWATQAKNQKLSNATEKLWAGYQWGTTDQLKQSGFKSITNEKYAFDIDEKDNLIVLDKKSGQKIPNPKVNSTFLSPEEVLQKEGIEMQVYKLNHDGGNQVPPTPQNPAPAEGTTTRRAIFADTQPAQN